VANDLSVMDLPYVDTAAVEYSHSGNDQGTLSNEGALRSILYIAVPAASRRANATEHTSKNP